MRLSEKHRKFCEALVAGDRKSATSAYQEVYECTYETAAVNASNLLKKANIQNYIAELREEIRERSLGDAERVLAELRKIAYANFSDYAEFDNDGVTIKPSKSLSKRKKAAIQSITVKTIRNGESESTQVNLRLHDKVRALEKMAEIYGLTTDFNKAAQSLEGYGIELTPEQVSKVMPMAQSEPEPE